MTTVRIIAAHIIRVVKSRRMTRTGHVERMRDVRNAYKIMVG